MWLYFYYFDLYTDFRRIGRGPDNCGVVSWQDGEKWQITVMRLIPPDEQVSRQGVDPDFPDCFCEGGEQAHALPGTRPYQAHKACRALRQPNETGGHRTRTTSAVT